MFGKILHFDKTKNKLSNSLEINTESGHSQVRLASAKWAEGFAVPTTAEKDSCLFFDDNCPRQLAIGEQ